MTPGDEVHILKPDDSARNALESLLAMPAIAPVAIPAGKISKDMLTDIAQENVGLAFNRIVSIAQSSDDKVALQAAKEVIEIAHPKNDDSGSKVIAPVQINLIVQPLNGGSTGEVITINTGGSDVHTAMGSDNHSSRSASE